MRNSLKTINCNSWNSLYISDPADLLAEADRMSTILDAKYSKADFKAVAQATPHLLDEEKKQLEQLLKKYESLFDGTVGTWNMDLVNISW